MESFIAIAGVSFMAGTLFGGCFIGVLNARVDKGTDKRVRSNGNSDIDDSRVPMGGDNGVD